MSAKTARSEAIKKSRPSTISRAPVIAGPLMAPRAGFVSFAHRQDRLRSTHRRRLGLCKLLQVDSTAERLTRTGQDDDPYGVISLDLLQQVQELAG
ncbi:hypothetical protein [Aeromicrobium sp. UC242_57]|uniref:hypothetical protein n=1 Tax=Aeromicrobium sp. UC242_57 TaxID=3374624 RepID=UPI0037AB38D6